MLVFEPLNAKIYLYEYIKIQFIPHRPCYKDQTINAVGEIITVYCQENNMEHINTLCRQTAEFFNVENRWHI
jgi:hypothetical protein